MHDLERSNVALEVCISHAEMMGEQNWHNAQVETVLASYVAATIYAEVESLVKQLTVARVIRFSKDKNGSKDKRVEAFGSVAAERLIRSIKINELAGLLGYFGPAHKDHFHDSLVQKEISDWDSIMNVRHSTAHHSTGSGSSPLLSDIKGYFASVQGVLTKFEESLNQVET